MKHEKKGPKTPDIVVNNISIRPVHHRIHDIQLWKEAGKAFENPINPTRKVLYDMYEVLRMDGHFQGVWSKRLDSIKNKELVFVRDGKEDEEINKVLKCPEMTDLLGDLLETVLYGYSLLQVNGITYDPDEETYHLDYNLIDRRHVHPERGFECVSKEAYFAERDFLYKNPPLSRYLIWAGQPTDKGLLYIVAQYIIYKRGGFGDWARYAEMFGMPFREARYKDYDEATRRELEKAMEEYGSAGYAILPEGAEYKIHDSTSGSNSNTLYSALVSACDNAISKAVLGNTLTTEQGDKGARSLGEVHQSEENEKKAADIKFIQDIIDSKFKAILKLFGFNTQGGNIWFKGEQNLTLMKEKLDIAERVSAMVPLADDYWYEEFSLPKPENYKELREKMDEKRTFAPMAIESLSEKKGGEETPLNRFLRFFAVAPPK